MKKARDQSHTGWQPFLSKTRSIHFQLYTINVEADKKLHLSETVDAVYSHNFLVTWCTTVVDKEVMSCMLHPVCVIGLEWQTSTVLMCAVSSVGEGSLQDVAMESQIRAHIRAGGRQSKYSNGGRGADCLQKKKDKGNSSCQLRLWPQSQVLVLKKKKKSVQCPMSKTM